MKFGLPFILLAATSFQLSSASKSTAAAATGSRSTRSANSIMHRKPTQYPHNSYSYDEEMDSLISQARSRSRSRSRTRSPFDVRGGNANSTSQGRMKVGFYFALWYALNVIYNSKYKAINTAN